MHHIIQQKYQMINERNQIFMKLKQPLEMHSTKQQQQRKNNSIFTMNLSELY